MKTSLLILAITLYTLSLSGQEDRYYNAMKSAQHQMDQASDPEQYLECANRFERIALAEKTRWIPYYYACQSLALMSFQEGDSEKRDLVLDRAQELLDQALAIEPGESELYVLQAFIYPSRIMVDPMGRGMIYLEKTFGSLEYAKTLNPENPRIYYLEGNFKLNIPAEMGGGAEVAKPIMEKALALFESFSNPDPLWPQWGEDATRTELEKLQ